MEDLPFDDEAFSIVLAAFGIGFAPRLEVALTEIGSHVSRLVLRLT